MEQDIDPFALTAFSLASKTSLMELRANYFKVLPEICTERPRLVTNFHVENGLFKKSRISIIDKARAYRFVLEEKKPIVRHEKAYAKDEGYFPLHDRSPFAGSTTSKFKGVPLFPEFVALLIWPELVTLSKRSQNPFQVREEEIEELNLKIFPHWLDHTVLEVTRKYLFEENLKKLGKKKYAPEIQLLQEIVFYMTSKLLCISHTIPDFSRVVRFGLRRMIDEAKEKQRAAIDPNKAEFYASLCEVSEGIIRYARNLSKEAGRLAGMEESPEEKVRLKEIAEIYNRIPEFPAKTFREGLTAVWIVWIALHLENPNIGLSLGRLDQILWDLYRKDVDEGRLTAEKATELVSFFWLKLGDHVPTMMETGEILFGGTGSNQAITLGGVDRQGQDAVNELTYVMLRATEIMRLRDPNLNARYFPGINSDKYLKRVCDVNVNTGATPAIHNDRAVIKALMAKGYTEEQARDYGIVGCVETVSAGRTYGHNAAVILNLASALELTLYNGRHRHTGLDKLISFETGDPTKFSSFDEFKDAFKKQLDWLIDRAVFLNNTFGKIHQDFYPTPILSTFFEGPMEKGLDVIQGGAVLNSSGAAIVALADVADSLSVIQKMVFLTKSKTDFTMLLSAIDANFDGYEALHAEIMKAPKFGNEDPLADANVLWLVEFLDQAFGKRKNYRGGFYRVAYWSMTIHAGLGRMIGAIPSGRKAGENFASGITPVSGVTPHLTSTLNSLARIPAVHISGGVALNLKYTPERSKDTKMLENFMSTVKGFFDDHGATRDGGMEVQFNITSREDLEAAIKNPEKYPELLVRVSGYTAYFRDLTPQMQKEILERTEYLLSSGRKRSFEPFDLKKK